MSVGPQFYKSKPEGIYKTSDSDYNCATCAYLINKQYCDLKRLKLDIFLLTKQRCRDFMSEKRGIIDNFKNE